MVRTPIQLTEEQVSRLIELAHTNSEPIAAIVRKALDKQPHASPENFAAHNCSTLLPLFHGQPYLGSQFLY